ncbi:hypothetical protein E2C01_097630 [Portunus trituberculatus]|uniref:Uncharacterized protein n=1 Tax=Portunus trituberculatus TaxID=210409 RepID=A0A5B7K683_PORTR|nr:hypothetical protein [Portunus trituberculatus]
MKRPNLPTAHRGCRATATATAARRPAAPPPGCSVVGAPPAVSCYTGGGTDGLNQTLPFPLSPTTYPTPSHPLTSRPASRREECHIFPQQSGRRSLKVTLVCLQRQGKPVSRVLGDRDEGEGEGEKGV